MTTARPTSIGEAIRLEATGGPMHRQLYAALRDAILEGRLPAGRRLPSSRAFATMFGLSRTTVMSAMDQLQAEGLVEGRRGSGTYVAGGAEAPTRPSRSRVPRRRPVHQGG